MSQSYWTAILEMSQVLSIRPIAPECPAKKAPICNSVRAMQYILDWDVNTKILDDLVHDLP